MFWIWVFFFFGFIVCPEQRKCFGFPLSFSFFLLTARFFPVLVETLKIEMIAGERITNFFSGPPNMENFLSELKFPDSKEAILISRIPFFKILLYCQSFIIIIIISVCLFICFWFWQQIILMLFVASIPRLARKKLPCLLFLKLKSILLPGYDFRKQTTHI